MTSPTNASSAIPVVHTSLTLTTLPIEVRFNILAMLSDIDSLNALSRSCRAFHHAYAANRKRLVFEISMREIGFGGEMVDSDAGDTVNEMFGCDETIIWYY